MQIDKLNTERRRVLAGGAAAGIVAMLPAAASANSPTKVAAVASDNFAFAATDENALAPGDASLPERARALIRIGEDGIARENQAAMEAFFHPDFRFHGPGGAELDREQLWGYFAACRAAFDQFTVTRQTIMSDGDHHVATRTRFPGIFARPFSGTGELIPPNGKPFEYRLINIFRYAPDGRLIEEWVQYDRNDFLKQLRA